MRALRWFLFVLYVAVLTYIVFFARRRHILIWHDDLVNLVPVVRTIQSFQSEATGTWNFFSNLFGNIILFIPLPIFVISLFGASNKLSIVLLGLMISLLIEYIQYTLRIGVPDIDDVLLNVLGVLLGVFLYKSFLSRNYSKSYLL